MAVKEIRICDRCGTEEGVEPRLREVGTYQDEHGRNRDDSVILDLCEVCMEGLKNEAHFIAAESFSVQRGFTEKQALDVLWVHLSEYPRHIPH